VDTVGGGAKVQIVSSTTQRILRQLMAIPIQRIEEECNRVANMYRVKWNVKNPSDRMIEEDLPNMTFEEGIKELYPDFLLTAPVSIHIHIFDCRIDIPYPQYSGNMDVAAGVPSGGPINPKLLVFLPTLQVNGSLIKWTNYRETFRQVIIHEFLHLYGDVSGLRRGVVDGRIRHNMIGTGAIEPLIDGLT
jgi:hypothetical protein